MLHVVSKQSYTWSNYCSHYVFFRCGHQDFLLHFLFSSHVFHVSLRDSLGVFRLKCLFYYFFLFIFQNFEVIISSNVVRYNCQTQMWRMTLNKKSTNNALIKNYIKRTPQQLQMYVCNTYIHLYACIYIYYMYFVIYIYIHTQYIYIYLYIYIYIYIYYIGILLPKVFFCYIKFISQLLILIKNLYNFIKQRIVMQVNKNQN